LQSDENNERNSEPIVFMAIPVGYFYCHLGSTEFIVSILRINYNHFALLSDHFLIKTCGRFPSRSHRFDDDDENIYFTVTYITFKK
jgi:hypothetical protein